MLRRQREQEEERKKAEEQRQEQRRLEEALLAKLMDSEQEAPPEEEAAAAEEEESAAEPVAAAAASPVPSPECPPLSALLPRPRLLALRGAGLQHRRHCPARGGGPGGGLQHPVHLRRRPSGAAEEPQSELYVYLSTLDQLKTSLEVDERPKTNFSCQKQTELKLFKKSHSSVIEAWINPKLCNNIHLIMGYHFQHDEASMIT